MVTNGEKDDETCCPRSTDACDRQFPKQPLGTLTEVLHHGFEIHFLPQHCAPTWQQSRIQARLAIMPTKTKAVERNVVDCHWWPDFNHDATPAQKKCKPGKNGAPRSDSSLHCMSCGQPGIVDSGNLWVNGARRCTSRSYGLLGMTRPALFREANGREDSSGNGVLQVATACGDLSRFQLRLVNALRAFPWGQWQATDVGHLLKMRRLASYQRANDNDAP